MDIRRSPFRQSVTIRIIYWGAVYFERGDVETGEHHYNRALELGASLREVEQYQRQALARADPVIQQRVAEYLLAKDSIRYGWARRYIS
jgi:hypothetical protein